ncbi:MAG: hypothetical protein COT73_11305 [Bdellovibrio sp. CG10_big_fil_rev_8_21_14_0_10_47_8]|nr:MAG: hypothetical protein COT73_11305 [Bdellovibrio sp. CG10_big_fil_rev_8_21_14_0_10_47_8]
MKQDYDTKNLTEFELHGKYTDIEVVPSSSNQLSMSWKGTISKFDQTKPPVSVSDDGLTMTMTIDQTENDNSLIQLGGDSGSGFIQLEVPKNIQKVVLKTVSGNIQLHKVNLKGLRVQVVSGDTLIENSDIENISSQSVSGDLKITGPIKRLSGASISGDMDLEIANASPIIDLKTTSGDCHFKFNVDPQVTIQYYSISGSASIDPELGPSPADGSKFSAQVGQGTGLISVKTTSGDAAYIRK